MKYKDLKPRSLKAPLHLLPARALRVVSAAMEDGAVKYAPWNWLEATADWRDAYGAAAWRHAQSFCDPTESDFTEDTDVHHLACMVASGLIGLTHAKLDGLPLDYRPSLNTQAYRILLGQGKLPENPSTPLLEALDRMQKIMEERGEL